MINPEEYLIRLKNQKSTKQQDASERQSRIIFLFFGYNIQMKPRQEPLVSEETRKALKEEFSRLDREVTVMAFLSDTENRPFSEYTKKLLSELALITDRIKPVFSLKGSDLAVRHGVSRTPTLLVQPEKYRIRLTGAPAGEEARTLLLAILMASTGSSIFSDASQKRLAELKEKRSIKVFVSPTCPYCPQQAAFAIAAAVERPELISAEIIEIYENKDLATQYNAFSVPQVFIDEQLVGMGLQPEEVFVEEILSAAPVETRQFESGGTMERDLVIIGAGPAGLTAAIYSARSGIRSVVLEKANIGGQVAITPLVENYPGFTKIGGKALMDMMAHQAVQYCEIHQGEEVLGISKENGRFTVTTNRARYIARAILIATGAESKKLDVPGEKEFQGRGVSYCAACDGYFFKDNKKVIVVGGGNTAATEALHLKGLGADVTIVHRRDRLRAEQYLQESIARNRIPVIWNTVVKEISGNKTVTGVLLENTSDGARRRIPVDGVFVAVGYTPSSGLAALLGVETDEEGYVKARDGQRTSEPGIYAAGDITGGIKQIVTAVSQGAVAATSIFEDLNRPYWKQGADTTTSGGT
ncbi:MAG: FAD-dependent oxidoreductase [Thermodesulfovibrionales bacterium]